QRRILWLSRNRNRRDSNHARPTRRGIVAEGTAAKPVLSQRRAAPRSHGKLGMESRPRSDVLVGGMLPCSEFRSTGWFAPIGRILSADSSRRPTPLQGIYPDGYPREGRV